jgi:hypothetical protein
MATTVQALCWAVAAGSLISACSTKNQDGGAVNAAATGGTAASAGLSTAGGGASGGGMTASGGASGGGTSGGDSGGATSGGVSANGGSSGDPAAGGSGGAAGSSGGGGGLVAAPGCAQSTHPVCMDFETLPDAKWTGIGTNVQTGHAAHGNAAFHGPPGSSISTTSLGTITNTVWGRFYLRMTPKAPVGHGDLVMLFDQPGTKGNWYEVGYEFNALQGNWHGNGGEKYMRTKMLLPDQWVCVEFFADGANAAPIQMWMDGVQIVYSDVASTPTISKTVKFANFTIGLTPYHGLSTINYEGNVMPMTDMWIDDIALDTQRIGCLAN